MIKNIINIGLPSKGRLKEDTLKVFKNKKLNILSKERKHIPKDAHNWLYCIENGINFNAPSSNWCIWTNYKGRSSLK